MGGAWNDARKHWGALMTWDAKKAIAYVRVSTDRQQNGAAAQLAAIRRWAKREGAEVVATFQAADQSGGVDLSKRAELLAAIDALGDHGAGVLVVAKRDRLARDTLTAATVDRMVARKRASVVSADGIGNGETPEAVLARRMADAFAEYERELISVRTREALAVKKAKGQLVGSVPYGWAVAADGVHLVEVASEQETIAIVRGLRAEGLSFRAVGARLTEMGRKPRSGGKWHATAVMRMTKTAKEPRS